MTLTKTASIIDNNSNTLCSPTEIHAIQMLLCGATSGRLKEWPVLVRALKKKGFDFDENDWCSRIMNELVASHYKLNPYCNDGLS